MGLTTFSTGLSGLATSSEGLSVVGNNLANLNTIGFKSSGISFSDVLGEQFSTPGTPTSGTSASVGLGAQVSGIRQNFGQGTLMTTGNPLDVAIQGDGFLIVNNTDGRFYTRAGNLQLDANGNLVSQSGANIQGYLRNPATGQIDSSVLQSIVIPANLSNPIPTSKFELGMNLDGSAAKGTQFSTAVQIYDSLGKAHTATLTFQKDVSTGSNPTAIWRFDITIPNKEVAGASPTDTTQLSLLTGQAAANPPAAGALTFDSTGKLTSAYIGPDPATPPPLANLGIPPSGVTLPALGNGATLNPALTWQLLDTTSNAPQITAFSTASTVSANNQDGVAAGSLSNIAIQPDGTIAAVFSNGSTISVAQLAMARFSNNPGLMQQGGGLYAESPASGPVFVGTPGQGGRGTLLAGSVEESNVDLATELTKIITFQRSYQANAKIITSTDQIMQDTINMKQ
jgi:flagellar hook protein FlgE